MQKIRNIEILRFLFILSIIACHLNQGITNFIYDIAVYEKFRACTHWAWLPVDFFFIISGFFLFLKTDFKQSIIDFAKNKLIRLLPPVWGVLLIIWIISLFTPLQWKSHENLFTILNIQNIGLTLQNGNIGPSWFVSSLFWGMCLYFYLYKNVSKEIFNLITISLIFICYSIFIHVPNHWNIINYAYFINMGMIRAFAGIGLGYFLCLLYKKYSNSFKYKFNSIKAKFFISMLEMYLFGTLFYYLCFYYTKYNNFLFLIIVFALLFICFLAKKGIVSNLFDNNLSVLLGQFTYSIFLTHSLVKDLWNIYIMNEYQSFVINNPIINLISIYFVTIFVGVITYYLIEKPCTSITKKWLEFNNNTLGGGVKPFTRVYFAVVI